MYGTTNTASPTESAVLFQDGPRMAMPMGMISQRYALSLNAVRNCTAAKPTKLFERSPGSSAIELLNRTSRATRGHGRGARAWTLEWRLANDAAAHRHGHLALPVGGVANRGLGAIRRRRDIRRRRGGRGRRRLLRRRRPIPRTKS